MPESLEDSINTLAEEGYYTKEELKKEAYRALLIHKPNLRMTLAVERYKKGKITLNKAAELAGITTEEMKEELVERGIKLRRGFIKEKRKEKSKELAGR